jgi:hypothetical protein
VLTASRELADYYEAVVKAGPAEPKLVANWVNWVISNCGLNKENLESAQSEVGSAQLAACCAHRRRHDLRQDREGSVRGDVGRRARCGRGHRGEGPQADHRHRRDRAR